MPGIQQTYIPLFENYCKQTRVDNTELNCKLGDFPIKLKVASTPESQQIGYQYSDQEPTDEEGILFVYPQETLVGFWMKNVKFPLDIMFFNSKKEMVHREIMEPETYPKIYKCNIPAQYAIETKSGWFDRKGNSNLKLHV